MPSPPRILNSKIFQKKKKKLFPIDKNFFFFNDQVTREGEQCTRKNKKWRVRVCVFRQSKKKSHLSVTRCVIKGSRAMSQGKKVGGL